MPLPVKAPRLQPTGPVLRGRGARRMNVPKRCCVVRADADEEEFEKRLAKLNKSKVPTGVSRKDLKEDSKSSALSKMCF